MGRFTRDADAGADPDPHTPVSILARLSLDPRLKLSLPFLFIGILGTGFLFTFYDIFDTASTCRSSRVAWP